MTCRLWLTEALLLVSLQRSFHSQRALSSNLLSLLSTLLLPRCVCTALSMRVPVRLGSRASDPSAPSPPYTPPSPPRGQHSFLRVNLTLHGSGPMTIEL